MSGRERWCLLRTNALGDVVLASAAADTVRAARPGAEITFVTRAAWAPLLTLCPAIDRIVTLEADAQGGDWAGLRGLARREPRPDAFVDLQGGMRGRVLAAAWGVSRVRLQGDGLARRLLVRAPRTGLPGRYWPVRAAVPAWRKMVDATLRALGTPTADARPPRLEAPQWNPPPDVRHPDRPLVVLCDAGRGAKRWPVAHVNALADLLTAEADVCVLSDAGVPQSGSLWARRPGGGWSVGASLVEAAALVASAHLVVAGDTGLAHLAAACGTPVVSLFGPTIPAFGFAPVGEGHTVVEHPLPCRPCSVHGTRPCWRGDHACLAGITPDEVAAVVRAALGECR